MPTRSDTVTSQRIEALRDFAVMDSPPEQTYDDLTFLASSICDTPISLISLLDEKRQWFKSRHGVDACETPIEQAFCLHAIQRSGIFEVKDATQDSRFAANPLVTGEPGIRFYAGVPLTTERGIPLGTLCVIDRCPRVLNDEQRRAMSALARQVMVQLELRRSKLRLEATVTEKQAALDELEALQGIIPICSYCKRIRDDDELWHQLEKYLSTYGQMKFFHGTCPECYPKVLKTFKDQSA
ncbi:MAG: GAF domain-containing protein [Rhodothermales bacterium]|jgi:GAF domain-containing protein